MQQHTSCLLERPVCTFDQSSLPVLMRTRFSHANVVVNTVVLEGAVKLRPPVSKHLGRPAHIADELSESIQCSRSSRLLDRNSIVETTETIDKHRNIPLAMHTRLRVRSMQINRDLAQPYRSRSSFCWNRVSGQLIQFSKSTASTIPWNGYRTGNTRDH